MRGVLLRGRRPPANRSAGPARLPVVSRQPYLCLTGPPAAGGCTAARWTVA